MEYVTMTAASDDGLPINVTIRKADLAWVVEREQAVAERWGSPSGVLVCCDPAVRV